MKIDYLSASRLQVFCDCPFKYFLQYHLKIPELSADTIHTHKGSAVHEALELYAKGDLDYELRLKEYYANHKVWEFDNRKPGKGFPHPQPKSCQTCKWAVHTAGGAICSIAARPVESFEGCPRENFEDDISVIKSCIGREESPLKRKLIGAEVPFKEEFDGFRVQGYIDLITEVDENTMEVRDYKTGNYAKKTDEAFKDLQMRIYSLVAKKLFPQYKYCIMTLDYLRKDPVTVCFGPEEDAKTHAFLREAYSKITSSSDPVRVKSFKCNWCIGYEACGKIRDQYIVDGKFKMPPPVEREKEVSEESETP